MKMVLVLLGSWILVLCEDSRLKTQVLGDDEEVSSEVPSRPLTSFIWSNFFASSVLFGLLLDAIAIYILTYGIILSLSL